MTDELARAVSERQHALTDFLVRERLGAFLATSPSGVYYLSGYRSQSAFQGFAAALIRPGEPPVLLHPILETEAVKRIPPFFLTRTWSDEAGPAAALGDLVASVTDAAVAVEERHLTVAFGEVVSAGSGRAIASRGELLDGLRLRKDAVEAVRARSAAARLDEVFTRALALPFTSRSELELQLDIEHELRLAGAEAWSVLVLGGPNTASPRARPGARSFAPRDVVLIDLAASFDRMWADVTRCASVDAARAEVENAWDVLRAANEAGVAAARVGSPVGAVDEATRAVIEEAGFGPAIAHRTGHGLGLDVIEAPSVSAENRAPIEAGMLFTVEPGIYFPGDFGLRLEDLVHARVEGPELLTGLPRELAVVS